MINSKPDSKAYRRPSRGPHPLAGQSGTGPPVVPPGWSWRIGKRLGDMYFISPSGVQIRSRLELLRHLNSLPREDAPREDQFCWNVTAEVLAAGDRCLPAPPAPLLMIEAPPPAQTPVLQLARDTSTLALVSSPEQQPPSQMAGNSRQTRSAKKAEEGKEKVAASSEPKMYERRKREGKAKAGGSKPSSARELPKESGPVDIASGTDVWRRLLGLPELSTLKPGPQGGSAGVHFSFPVEGGYITAHVNHGGRPTGYFTKNPEQPLPKENRPQEKALKEIPKNPEQPPPKENRPQEKALKEIREEHLQFSIGRSDSPVEKKSPGHGKGIAAAPVAGRVASGEASGAEASASLEGFNYVFTAGGSGPPTDAAAKSGTAKDTAP